MKARSLFACLTLAVVCVCARTVSAQPIPQLRNDLGGTAPAPEVVGILDHALPSLSLGYMYWNGSAWVFQTPSSASVSGTGLWYSASGVLNSAAVGFSGDATLGALSGGNLPLTLATVNSNVGSFGDSAHVAQLTLNAKGLVTAASSVGIAAPLGAATGTLAIGQLGAGSSAQLLVTNSGGTAAVWVTESGDVTLAASGAQTLATVNSNTGSWGSATAVATFTVNGKGLITAASNTSIAIPLSQLTQSGATSDQVAEWNGSAWAPATLPSGASVTGTGYWHNTGGTLDSAASIGTADQLTDTNHAGTATEWFTLGGDCGFASHNITCTKINGTSVPAGGGLTTGNQLIVSGASAATWSALNLAGGSGYVTGTLPIGNEGAPTGTGVALVSSGAWTAAAGTVNLTSSTYASGLTQYDTLVGGSAGAVAQIAPSSTSGYAYQSNGSSANPSFAILGAVGGGTGASSPSAHDVAVAEGASAFSFISPSTSGYLLESNGTGSDPSFQAQTTITQVGTLTAGSLGSGFTLNLSLPTISNTLSAANGGTGTASPTANGVAVANGSSAFNFETGTTGQVLTWNASGPPTFQAAASGVTWADDMAGSTNSAQYVAAISGHAGAGGNVPLASGTTITATSSAAGDINLSAATDGKITSGSSGFVGPSLDTSSASTLSIGTANANAIHVGGGASSLTTSFYPTSTNASAVEVVAGYSAGTPGFIVNNQFSGGKAAGLVAGTSGSAFYYDTAGLFQIVGDTNAHISPSTIGEYGTVYFKLDTSGNVTIANLAGTGYDPVIASSAGLLSRVASSTASGAPLLNQGTSSVPAYGALNLAGGSSIVTGLLPGGNLGTITLTGDVTGSASGGSIATTVAAISGTTPILITPNELRWTAGTTAPELSQAAASSGAGADILVKPQAATTTGASGNLTVNVSAPASGTTEAGFKLERAGTFLALMSRDPSFSSYTDLWMGDALSPGANNYALTSSGSVTALNSTGDTIIGVNGLTIAEATSSAFTVPANVQLGSNTTSFGGGSTVVGITNATSAPTSAPSGGGVLSENGGQLNHYGSGGAKYAVAPTGIGTIDQQTAFYEHEMVFIKTTSGGFTAGSFNFTPANSTDTLVKILWTAKDLTTFTTSSGEWWCDNYKNASGSLIQNQNSVYSYGFGQIECTINSGSIGISVDPTSQGTDTVDWQLDVQMNVN